MKKSECEAPPGLLQLKLVLENLAGDPEVALTEIQLSSQTHLCFPL